MTTHTYDLQKTKQHKADSMFHIHSYSEEWYVNGKQVNELKHDAIPHNMEVGAMTKHSFVADKKMKTKFGYKKVGKINVGDIVNVCLMPICGRLKKKLT